MVRMWSSGEEHVRVMAFVGLSKLLKLTSSELLDFSIKVRLAHMRHLAVHTVN